MSQISERLEYLRGEIRAERISWGEIHELQGLAEHIDPDDVELLTWAGVPEFPEEKTYKIVRFFADERPSIDIDTGLTLEEAQAHCKRDDTRGDGWFDGYTEE